MDGIEKIVAKIEADAKAEIEALTAEAKAEADAIAADSAAKAQAITAELTAQGRKNAAEREERLASVALLDARNATLTAKQELLDRAFTRALEKLCTLEDEAYINLLAKLLAKASRTGKEQVALNPADRSRVGSAAVARANELLKGGALTLAESTRPIKGGFILIDGPIETNCAFETLVRLERNGMAAEVAALLFG